MKSISDLDQLAALIQRERDGLLSRWRHQVRELPSAQRLDAPTLNDHVPQLIDELAAAAEAKRRRRRSFVRRACE
jgi:two-component system phosphate regulon sensor histidine kinase PhoR